MCTRSRPGPDGDEVLAGSPDVCIPGELARGTAHDPEALNTWAVRSHQLLPLGSVARKNRRDSKASARPALHLRKARTGLPYGNLSGIPPRGTDSTGPGTEVQTAGDAQHCLQAPGPDAKDQNRRGTHSITHRRGRQALVPQAGHCTNPYIQPGEVTGVRAVPHVVAKKHDGKFWVLGPGIQSLSEAHGCASCSLKGVPGLSGWALCVLGRGDRGG